MSAENVATVRQVYEAAARRDSETVLALYHPEVELDPSRLGVMGLAGTGGGVYHGHEGLRRFFASGMRPGEASNTTTRN